MDAHFEIGSRHVLTNRLNGSEAVFVWQREGWETPGSGYTTKPAFMSVLGWRYSRPEATRTDKGETK